ncbi:MAG: DUF3106 domain-containing protein [Bdellovibrio sp.]|nr:DUF3106 domain-containing protein [Methylotenera sp.]
MVGLQATTLAYATDNIQVALGDLGSIKSGSINSGNLKSSLNGESAAGPIQTWAQLTDDQRKVLAPLGSQWDTLRPWQREKMLDIAHDYPKMDAQKQQLVQKRLISWSRMTPYERENARKRYQEFSALSADKKDEVRKKWSDYQKLPDAERAKLRRESAEWDFEPEL